MNIDEMLLKQAKELLSVMDDACDDSLPKDVAEIVKFHAKGATAAALASAWIPGAGGTAAIAACAGFIWTMYGRIGSKINLPISSNILKTLAFGVATNLASAAVGSLAISTALSFIPGLGSIGASVIMGGVCYAMTIASGFVFLKTMTALFTSGVDPTKATEQELQGAAKQAASSNDVSDVLRQAKSEFKSKKAQGEFK